VPGDILQKRGPLAEEELAAIRKHTERGAEMVAHIEGLEVIAAWIRHSHESFDGSGYPDGLSGEEIPQASRILLAADAFDAMTSRRPYNTPLSREDACEELRRNAGTQFDPACVDALLAHLDGAGDLPSPAVARGAVARSGSPTNG
jgi:HD-GYP domain-containing protein (c-di-GMP phosphodiesterase class II)